MTLIDQYKEKAFKQCDFNKTQLTCVVVLYKTEMDGLKQLFLAQLAHIITVTPENWEQVLGSFYLLYLQMFIYHKQKRCYNPTFRRSSSSALAI